VVLCVGYIDASRYVHRYPKWPIELAVATSQ